MRSARNQLEETNETIERLQSNVKALEKQIREKQIRKIIPNGERRT